MKIRQQEKTDDPAQLVGQRDNSPLPPRFVLFSPRGLADATHIGEGNSFTQSTNSSADLF